MGLEGAGTEQSHAERPSPGLLRMRCHSWDLESLLWPPHFPGLDTPPEHVTPIEGASGPWQGSSDWSLVSSGLLFSHPALVSHSAERSGASPRHR